MIAKSSLGGQNWREKTTLTVPEAGRLLGLNRNASYVAASRKEIPTLRFGKLLRVPTAALVRMLDGNARP